MAVHRRGNLRDTAPVRLRGGCCVRLRGAVAAAAVFGMALCACAAQEGVVDPDAIGAAFAAGTITMESFARAHERDEIWQLEEAVASGQHHGSSPARARRPTSYNYGKSGIAAQESSVEDECADLAQCSCACFCRGKCLRSQSIPHELALFSRSRSALQGALTRARDILTRLRT